MNENIDPTPGATPEQMLYAKILNKGMLLGMLMLAVTFILYITGVFKPYIPVEKLSNYWHLSAHDYLTTLNISDGWGWVSMLGYGDFLNFIGIAFLAGVTIICYAAIVPTLLKNNDKVYALIAIVEVIVLTLAATGLITGGH